MKETLRDLFRQKFNYSEYRKVILQNLLTCARIDARTRIS